MKRILNLSVAALALASNPASAYTTLFAFGNSISDAGNFALLSPGTLSPPYYQGHFSNGPTWVEDLSPLLGLGTLKPALAGGGDYAVGGARTYDLLAQINYYAQSHPKPVPGALYTLDTGGGDIIDALASYSAGAISISQVYATVVQAEATTVHDADLLYGLGARNLLFYEVPNLGLFPAMQGALKPLQPLANNLVTWFDDTTLRDLRKLEGGKLKVFELQTYGGFANAVANPAAFGLTNVHDPCWTGGFSGFAGGGTLCSNPDQYLFWDGLHPTAYANVLTAQMAYQTLTAGALTTTARTLPVNALAAAPEPATWAMMLLGFCGLGFAGYRSARRRAVRSPIGHHL